jgi:hypothetical protein
MQVSNDDDQPETKDHVHFLESVSDAPDCLYLHLRSNPSLCCRSTDGRRREPATVVPNSPTSEVVEKKRLLETRTASERLAIEMERPL